MITVTKGQWFPLTISNVQYGGADFDLQEAKDVKAALVSSLGTRAELSFTVSAYNELSAVCDGNIAPGKYSVEVTAVGSDGKNYRMRSPLAVIEITSSTTSSGASKARIQGDNWELTADVEMHEGQARTYMSLLEVARKATLAAKDKADGATDKANDALTLANEAKATADGQAKTLMETNSAIVEAEQARAAAEQARVSAENARAAAEAERQAAEGNRAYAETARQTAETARQTAENKRSEAEQARKDAENARVTAEDARKEAETARVTEESKRAKAEAGRAKAETTRAEGEQGRKDAEDERVTAETARKDAETKRATAETERETAFANAKKAAEDATGAANTAADRANTAMDKVEKVLKETISVTLTCNHDETLSGKKVYVKNTADDSTLFETAWNGEALKFSIAPDQSYYVTADAMDGYTLPKSDKFTAISGNVRETSLVYESEWFYPTITTYDGKSCDGQRCTLIKDNERADINYKDGMVIKIPFGVEYTITPLTKQGYFGGYFPRKVSRDAEYRATATYKEQLSIIGIQMKDGTILSGDDWDTGKYSADDVNGFAVATTGVQCVIHPKGAPSGGIIWSPNTEHVEGCDYESISGNAVGCKGEANTEAIVKKYGATSGYAAGLCYNTIMLNGRRCYLPAIDEMTQINANMAAINALSQKVYGYDVVNQAYRWSSTLCEESHAWGFDSYAYTNWRNRGSKSVLPVSAL